MKVAMSGLGTILAASGATLNLSGTGLNVINAVQVAGSISNTGGTNTLSGPVTLTANVAVLVLSPEPLNEPQRLLLSLDGRELELTSNGLRAFAPVSGVASAR